MKAVLLVIPLFLIGTSFNAIGQDLSGPLALSVNPWTGSFSGSINGTASTLVMQCSDDLFQGTIDAGGYLYQLKGTVQGNAGSGDLVDEQNGATMPYTAVASNGRVDITIDGQNGPFTMSFGNATVAASSDVNNNGTVALDQGVIGYWTYSESYTSGTYSFASQWNMALNPDGTFEYGKGQVAGGGLGVSGTSGEGEVTRGQWKTENSNIYINEGYGWELYCGYYLEGNSLMLKFNDGSNQVWYR